MEFDPDLSQGLCESRNFTEDELFLQAKRNHYNSECYRPCFFIRIHNLPCNGIPYHRGKNIIYPQDFTINISLGEIYSLGQRSIFEEVQHKGEIINKKDNNAITLFRGSYSPFLSPEHCIVGRDEDDNKVWVCDLNSKQGTFVNGSILSPGICHKLKNGDIVSFGISHLDEKCQLDNDIFWVFKYREGPKEEQTHLKSLYSQVFGNNLILSNILKKLYPYKNQGDSRQMSLLLKFRQVSKFWNGNILPIIRRQFFTIGESGDYTNERGDNYFKSSETIWDENFLTKKEIFTSMGLQKWHVSFAIGLESEIKEAEFIIFENFFRSYESKILKITLGFSIIQGYRRHLHREKVLQSLFNECKSIVHFLIEEDCSVNLANVVVSTATKILTISCQLTNYEIVFKTFPNVVEIRFGADYMEKFFMFLSNPENEQFVKDNLRHLRALKLVSDSVVGKAKKMKPFPIKIEKFLLDKITIKKQPTDEISNIISGFADSLKQFKLIIALSEEKWQAGLKFPKMENLENLEISLNGQNIEYWNFELGGFPNLKHINIESDRREDVNCDKHNFLECLLSKYNRKKFPKLERAFISYGQLQSKSFAYSK